VYPHRRRISSEIISLSESGVVFKHSLEYPHLPQPPRCLLVNADDRHQRNITKSDQKDIYRAHRAHHGTFREHSGNIARKSPPGSRENSAYTRNVGSCGDESRCISIVVDSTVASGRGIY
jgi:hypothetical protein